jgi:hypothetical protein
MMLEAILILGFIGNLLYVYNLSRKMEENRSFDDEIEAEYKFI